MGKSKQKKIDKNVNIEDIEKEIKQNVIKEDTYKDKKKNGNILLNILLIVLLIVSLVFFVITLLNKNSSISSLIANLLLTFFTVMFVVVAITYARRKKLLLLFCTILLLGYFGLELKDDLFSSNVLTKNVPDFRGKNITEVIRWASKNKIPVQQEYEYSDMISEYFVISQKSSVNKKDNKIKELAVSISEGANPSKEIMIPDMVSWDSERVLSFVKDNYLSHVVVEFVSSDKAKDTVIEQSVSGNLKRDEELKLTFSYGEELGFDEVTLIDFKNKSRFEVEFYMKQNQLRYEFIDDFDSSIKKGFAIKQDHEAGSKVHVDDEKIQVTISKGPEIKVPDLKKYNMTKITDWAIKNKVKLNFSSQYDDSIKENGIISANYNEGDVIEQGTVVKVVTSRGKLKMPVFSSLNDFYTWANKYNIKYEEEHEFSDTVPAGEVIRYSYKDGDIIKNGDSIKVIISDGEKKTVPNLKGLSKSEVSSKLDKLGLKYTFLYSSSNSIKKNYVISQSISAGSEISNGVTITVTLSNGEKESTAKERKTDNKSNEKGSNSDNNSNPTPASKPESIPESEPVPTPEPTPEAEKVTVYIYDELIKSSPSATCSAIKSVYPKLNFSCSYICGSYNGALMNSPSIDEHTFSTNDTINLKISDNSKC